MQSVAGVLAVAPANGANGQPLVFPRVDYLAILPELILCGAALVLLLMVSIFKTKPDHAIYSTFTAAVAGVAVASTFWLWDDVNKTGARAAYAGAIARDHYHLFFVVVIGIALLLSTLITSDWLQRQRIEGPEFYVLAMLSAAGGMLMAGANDLIVVFLALEILSIALYVLAGFNRRDEKSREAAIKYFVLGAFSSAIFLYGVALVYGATGTTNLSRIASFLATNLLIDNGLLLAGMAMLAVGFGFKVAAVPFHQWTPDVYEGSPTPITGFMAAAAKAAGFAAFIRVFIGPLFSLKLDWQPILLVLAIVTLLVGSIVACVQTNVKRMLAYSSISHAGYVLLGLQAATVDGVSASLFYLLAYTFMVIGGFAVVTAVSGRDDREHDLEAFRGLGRRRPLVALGFAVLLLAQAGVPLTSGFLAKFYVISALARNGSYGTAIFAMLAAAVAAYFYLRIITVMYSPAVASSERVPSTVDAIVEPDAEIVAPQAGTVGSETSGVATLEAPPIEQRMTHGAAMVGQDNRDGFELPPSTWLALSVAVAATLVLGVIPQSWLDALGFARRAAADLFPVLPPP